MQTSNWLRLFAHALFCALLLSPPMVRAVPAHTDARISQTWLTLANQELALDRAILGVPLLMYQTAMEAEDEPEMAGTGTRCFFQVVGETLYLMRSTQGLSHTSTFLTAGVLAVFPITEQNAEHVRFHFTTDGFADAGGGLAGAPAAIDAQRALLAGGRQAIGATSLQPLLVTALSATPAYASVEYVDGLQRATRLTFWRADVSSMPVQMDNPDDAFGYFNDEYAEKGQHHTRYVANRLDPRVSHTFYISAGTPPAYRDAIAQGVLGWNAVFGREFLRVADAPASVRPGDPQFFLIQWMEMLDYAVGYWQSHPDTGEVLSSWIMIGAPRIDRYARDYVIADWRQPPTPQEKGFCRSERFSADDTDIAELLGETVASSEVDSQRLEVMKQRIITGVVLHEVGHVLGLRHNFAANLQSEISPQEERTTVTAALFGNEAVRAALPLPGNSVMDYYTFTDRLRMSRPGAYDAAAIAQLYELSPPVGPKAAWLFCSDEHVNLLADCSKGDQGAEPIRGFAQRLEWLYTRFSAVLFATISAPMPNTPLIATAQRDPRLRYILAEIEHAKGALSYYQVGFVWQLAGQAGWERKTMAASVLAHFAVSSAVAKGSLHAWFAARSHLWRAPLAAQIERWLQEMRAEDAAVAHRAREKLERIRWELAEPIAAE